MSGMDFPVNPNIPPGYELPGVFTSFLLADPGATAPNNKALLFGYVTPGAPADLNTPFLPVTQDVANAKCGHGGAMLARVFAAARAQLGPAGVGAELWCVPIAEPSGGTAATHLIKFMSEPVFSTVNGKWQLGAGTAASKAGTGRIFIGPRLVANFGWRKDDDYAAVAAAAKTAMDKAASAASLEVTSAHGGTATLTLTDRHKGKHGNYLPIRVDLDPGCDVAASPGTIAFTGSAGASGTATLLFNGLASKPCTYAITNGDANTVSGTGLLGAINAKAFPVLAAEPAVASGTITLFFRPERWVHLISISLASVTVQTAAVAAGTAGAGDPDISEALTTLASDPATAYRAWSVFWFDTTNWSTTATHVEGQAISPIEKGQTVHGADTRDVTTVGALTSATTPTLKSSPRYVVDWAQGVPMRPWEVSARTAVMVAAGQRPSLNFNFTNLRGSDDSPVAAAPRADRPTQDELNTGCATYGLCPIATGAAGLPQVLLSRTTYNPVGYNDRKLVKWSCILTLDYYRQDLKAYLFGLFGEDKKIKAVSPARTFYSVDTPGVKEAVYRKMKEWDDRDLYDGAEQSRDAIKAGVLESPTRINVALPMRPPADLDQLSVVGLVQ